MQKVYYTPLLKPTCFSFSHFCILASVQNHIPKIKLCTPSFFFFKFPFDRASTELSYGSGSSVYYSRKPFLSILLKYLIKINQRSHWNYYFLFHRLGCLRALQQAVGAMTNNACRHARPTSSLVKDVHVNSETSTMTSSVSRFASPTQYFRGVYRDKVYASAFIGMSVHLCI